VKRRSSSTTIRAGISGWRYAPWRGVFYPPGLPQRRELWFASRALPTLEINGSHYSLQHPRHYAEWFEQTPDDFVFSVKGPRYITHMLRLKKIEAALANFLASGVLRLNQKLGPMLWQFPANLAFDADVVDAFLALLPRTTAQALALARGHDQRLEGRSHLEIDVDRPLRHALEVRSPSFVDPRFTALLRKHGAALVVADTAGKWPDREDVTADFVYVRLHGAEELYASGYSDAALASWAERIAAWQAGGQASTDRLIEPRHRLERTARDVYVYFDNDIKVHAPFDAGVLSRLLHEPCAMNGDGRFEVLDTEPARIRKAAESPTDERWLISAYPTD
jgi:uncharacterized protein YecE (DUF72 family)